MNYRRTFYPLFLALLLVLSPLFFAACTSAPETEEDDRDQFIGRPPPPERDDPFFAHALPAETVPAEPSGRIGDRRRAEEPREPVETARPDEPTEPDEPAASQEIAALEEPERPVDDRAIPPETPDEKPSCFSCVRICHTNDDGSANCSEAADDLICGWGSHDNSEEARRTARAQCDATLDMARHMPNYSEIAGSCPPATCR